jgi:aldose 1-epimerase
MHTAQTRSARRTAARAATVGTIAATVLALGGTLAFRAAPTAAPGHHCAGPPTVSKRFFGLAFDLYAGKKLPVFQYTMRNCQGMTVQMISLGATNQSITVPGRHGHEANVILGFKTLGDYVTQDSPPPPAPGGPYFGETVGRYANRIANATFMLEGKTYTLPVNNGPNSLHGGFNGFQNHVWASKIVRRPGLAGAQFTLVSPNGDEGSAFEPSCHCTGYPGTLTVVVTYLLDNHNRLWIHYHATVAGHDTVLNLTNHDYFNLAGESSGDVYRQQVMINADTYTPTNTVQIPTGAIVPVAGTPFDFRTFHPIGARITANNAQLIIAHGYDHNWVLNAAGPHLGPLVMAAQARDPRSGRELTVWTDQPGVQFYSGNFLQGNLVGISGHLYRQSWGYTFETQHYPNSPNQSNFPSTVLKVGQQFNSTTVYQFSTF